MPKFSRNNYNPVNHNDDDFLFSPWKIQSHKILNFLENLLNWVPCLLQVVVGLSEVKYPVSRTAWKSLLWKMFSVWMWAAFFEGGKTHVFLLPLLRSKQFVSASLKSGSHAQALALSESSLWSWAGSFTWLGPGMGLVDSLSLLVSKSNMELVLHFFPENNIVLWCFAVGHVMESQ